MWHNDELCRRAADEGSWALRGPDCVKVHRLHVCLCLFCLSHYRTVQLCCVSALSQRGKVTGRGHMSINTQLLDSCWRDKRRLDDCCRLRQVENVANSKVWELSEDEIWDVLQITYFCTDYFIIRVHKCTKCFHIDYYAKMQYTYHTGNGPQDECEMCYNGVSLLAKVSLFRLATASSS